MKRVILCLLLAAGLAGCSTTTAIQSETDYDKVAAIERQALRSGVQVIWVNYPTRVVR